MPEPLVEVSGGKVRGTRDGGVAVFRGIPYAAAPVGDLRFRAPAPAPAWSGVRDATAAGPTAPMPGYPPPFDRLLANPVVAGDDYLNLTVWSPAPGAPDAGGRGLPVLVWIHGGAFVNGSSAVPYTDGSSFARDGVVTVALNYRLGVEGFALLPDAPANRGLLDQVAALEWVRENVAAFGGDPGNVTVAGESAGAMSIGTLLAMPRAAGLFRRAVLQSGAAHHTLSRATAARVAAFLADELGVPATAVALRTVPSARLIAAQQALARQLQRAPDPGRWGEVVVNLMPFEPVVDGEVLPGPPTGAAAEGVDVLVGTNRHEYRLFLVPTGLADQVTDAGLAAVAAGYGLSVAGLDAYRAAVAGASPGEVLGEVATDWFYRIPALRVAESVAGSHVYEFGWEAPDGLGACHGLEVPFVFDTLDDPDVAALTGPAAPRDLAAAVHRAWVAFATTGDPGWPAYAPDRSVARLGDGADAAVDVVRDPRGDLRELWAGIR